MSWEIAAVRCGLKRRRNDIMVEYLSGEAESATREGRAASEMSQNTLIPGIPYNDTMGFLVPSKLGLLELKSDDTRRFFEFPCKMKLHLINLCLQARIDFYNQQKEEQKANRAKYREKVRRQKKQTKRLERILTKRIQEKN